MLDMLLHALENTNIPHPWRDWDVGKADIAQGSSEKLSKWLEIEIDSVELLVKGVPKNGGIRKLGPK